MPKGPRPGILDYAHDVKSIEEFYSKPDNYQLAVANALSKAQAKWNREASSESKNAERQRVAKLFETSSSKHAVNVDLSKAHAEYENAERQKVAKAKEAQNARVAQANATQVKTVKKGAEAPQFAAAMSKPTHSQFFKGTIQNWWALPDHEQREVERQLYWAENAWYKKEKERERKEKRITPCIRPGGRSAARRVHLRRRRRFDAR